MTMVLAALDGYLWPIEITPDWMQSLALTLAERFPMTLDPYSQAQLEADLELSLLERVLESERMALILELRAPRARFERLLMFDRYEDYVGWKDREDRAP